MNILYGVCGISNGHTYRQRPIIQALAEQHRVLVFAYANSLRHYKKYFRAHPRVDVQEVAVQYIPGNKQRLDFEQATHHPRNQGVDFHAINNKALQYATQRIGTPDLVVSDYEPTSARYAYATGAPLVTLDQQSKLLPGPHEPINGYACTDEIMRLRMFFPKAHKRIACSFFDVPDSQAEIIAPVLREEITSVKRAPDGRVLVYVSAQQPVDEQALIHALQEAGVRADAYIPGVTKRQAGEVTLRAHGSDAYVESLRRCSAILSTAGHSLLSEAMYLGIPVYATPLPLYEQQLNAKVIADNNFGVSHETIRADTLRAFMKNLYSYEQAIKQDTDVLLKNSTAKQVIRRITQSL